MRVALCGILKHGEVGEDQRVCTQLRCHINGTLPARVTIRVRKGVNRNVRAYGDADGQNSPLHLQFFLTLGKIGPAEADGRWYHLSARVGSISAVLDGALSAGVSGRGASSSIIYPERCAVMGAEMLTDRGF